jgi:hypothetical protein
VPRTLLRALPGSDNCRMPAPPVIRLAAPADAPGIACMSRDWIEHGLGWSWTTRRIRQAMADPSTNVAVLVLGVRGSSLALQHPNFSVSSKWRTLSRPEPTLA